MEYPFLTFLWIVKLILTLLAGTAAVYFLLQLFKQPTKFQLVLKGVVFYEICVVLVSLVYPKYFALRIFGGFYGAIISFLVLIVIFFAISYYISRKYFLVNIKKSLAIFFVMIFASSLFLGIFEMIEPTFRNMPFFANDSIKFENKISQFIDEHGISSYINSEFGLGGNLFPSRREYYPLSFDILEKIEIGGFAWYSEYIMAIFVNR